MNLQLNANLSFCSVLLCFGLSAGRLSFFKSCNGPIERLHVVTTKSLGTNTKNLFRREQAMQAAQSVCGSLSNPLLVVPFNKTASDVDDIDYGPSTSTGVDSTPMAAASLGRPSRPLFPSHAPAFPVASAAGGEAAGASNVPAGNGPGRQPPSPSPLFPAAFTTARSQPLFGAASTFPSGSVHPSRAAPASSSAFGTAPSSFPGAAGSSFNSFPGSAPGGGGGEGAVLEKMRRAAEREKLLAELQQQDNQS